MKKIRNNVFETNSSSTHALTTGRVLNQDYIPYGNNLKIKWFDEEETLTTLQDKVSYLVSISPSIWSAIKEYTSPRHFFSFSMFLHLIFPLFINYTF